VKKKNKTPKSPSPALRKKGRKREISHRSREAGHTSPSAGEKDDRKSNGKVLKKECLKTLRENRRQQKREGREKIENSPFPSALDIPPLK